MWQPIETAPRDGKLLLLWNDDIYFIGYGTKAGWFCWSPGELWSQSMPYDEYRPITHWMPLPAAPETEN